MMASAEVLSHYVKKLSHPLKEIRERSLQLLIAKLQLGWELDDELSGTRELLEALLAWFHVQQPALQREALLLLRDTIKTKTGTYIAKELGIKKIISTLIKVRNKIEPDALDIYNDLTEMLRFLNTVVSEENIVVPPLNLHSLEGSESDGGSSSGYYNPPACGTTSKESSVSNDDCGMSRHNVKKPPDGVKVLLFPWVDICSSDSKTMLLVEDALKLLKSTRRCCRFIGDVFLRDFPAEIFLNRPAIIKHLLSISEGSRGGHPGEALHVLLCITRSLRARLRQLTSLELIHDSNKITEDERDSCDQVNMVLEQQIAGYGLHDSPREEDALAALKQLPAPLYALDAMHDVLSAMARSIVLVGPGDKQEVLDLKQSNTCLALVESLVQLLTDCVTDDFWCMEHSNKTHRDIAHKSCMVMRLLADLLLKYRKSFSEDPNRWHHRVAWLRLASCSERLFHWSRYSALPPSSLATALQAAQLDPGLEMFYPALSDRIAKALQNTKTTVDQEYKSKYRELKKLFDSMDHAAQFMRNKNPTYIKTVLSSIKNSVLALEMHQSEAYLDHISDILLNRTQELEMEDCDWSIARSIALSLFAHNIDWVKTRFYKKVADMVRTVLTSDETNQAQNEKCLTLLCDVGILTEICCHGISSQLKEIESSASNIILYLLRGRLVVSEGCWWRLLASLMPVLPLLHVYAAHDTHLGQAICKSLETDIATCMGVPLSEVVAGLVRLLFVRCPPVQLDAAHGLCHLLDDQRYLPPREALRTDVLISALSRVELQDFNVDYSGSPSKSPQTTGLMQILDVLKQDITLEEHGTEFSVRPQAPILEPSLRRSTLQQLAVLIRQQDVHEAFLQCEGLKIIIATLRMSMIVDDYLAYPECAISCVSILNSVCFLSRHFLAKTPDLLTLLLRVILIFPANDSAVAMSAQVLALVAWSGFALQELDANRRRVPALPLSVTQRTSLPFAANSYWNTSTNAEHSSLDWLLSDEDFRAAIRMHWWCACEGGTRVILGAPLPPAPLILRPTAKDLASLRAASPVYASTKLLMDLENATSHKQVNEALNMLHSYTYLLPMSSVRVREFGALPWQHTQRFLCAPPASSRDTLLLIAMLQFVISYLDNVGDGGEAVTWIKSYFIGKDASIISLLSRTELYPQQTSQESIEVTQLHIHIVKVLLRCIILLEDGEYDSERMESLIKILLSCLERVDLKNFHMLGYLNELVRTTRFALNTKCCKLSEETLIQTLGVVTETLTGCACGGGRKGQACRLDALLALLAVIRQAQNIPVQRWSDPWSSEVARSVVACSRGARPELRAAALRVMAALSRHTQLLPQLQQATPEECLSKYAAAILSETREANLVRTAAALLLASVAARPSTHSDDLQKEMFEQLRDNNFLETALEILVDFCKENEHNYCFEPNVPLSLLERRNELEVRAKKSPGILITPSLENFRGRVPPTADLVAATADVIYNVSLLTNCPVQTWNDRGLYRILFRCASWPSKDSSILRARASACLALTAASSHKCVRATLANTKDCLYNLLMTMTSIDDDNEDLLSAHAKAFQLLGCLLTEKATGDNVWRVARDKQMMTFFVSLLQSVQSECEQLQEAGLYCLTQLSQSAIPKKHPGPTKGSRVDFLDNLPSPFVDERQSGGDTARNDCQSEYMAEEFVKVLMELYKKQSLESKMSSDGDRWSRITDCLSSLLSISPRSRLYGVHRQLPRILLSTLQTVRDRLTVHGPVDVIKSANNNSLLRTLHSLLTCICCHMVECSFAKEAFADDNLALSLNRLWPWCMLTDQLRTAVIQLLVVFSNDCPKAWAAMSSCVSGRSLVGEICLLAGREATLQSRPRPDAPLLACLRTLRQLHSHHHCRAIILKSDVLLHMYKLRVRDRGGSGAGVEWARLCECLARHTDGAGAILALRPLLAAPAVRARLMPAIAHVARHRRTAVLQAPDLLELLSGTLLAGDTAEIVSAARAVWALAANNHKAKLLLRSSGVASSVQSALQRMQRLPSDGCTDRALQLLIYTNNVLQST